MNIYLIGVGGQGIGLLSEVLIRTADHAGIKATGVDTHGLAQRGGVVISQLRLGENSYSPLINKGEADLVIALERHEALRGLNDNLRDGGTLIYYNAVWQPLEVRLNKAKEIKEEVIQEQCEKRNIKLFKVIKDDLEDARMQNVVLLANIHKNKLIPNIEKEHYIKAMEDLMDGSMLEKNIALFEEESPDI
ncbi:MAG: 2-oxoacid:acceptor oxidoreductase family protein [Ignavibacteria bacterium]|nr:2-oxoacid:acceptor oxidoreductase family protein [Ignavibacteria bacterium]